MNHSVMRAIAGTALVFIVILMYVLKHFGGNELINSIVNAYGAISLWATFSLLFLYALNGKKLLP